jgi:hypothetical protein
LEFPNEVKTFVRSVLDKYNPLKGIVIDIGLLDNGLYKVIEYNTINCSGFYDIDVELFVDAVENKIIKEN